MRPVIFHRIVSTLMVLSLLTTFFYPLERAYAIAVVDIKNIGVNIANGVLLTTGNGSLKKIIIEQKKTLIQEKLQTKGIGVIGVELGALVKKEFVLDKIGWQIANLVLGIIAEEIVIWINSGFEGSPSFLTNFDQFLLGIADDVAGDFIYGTELGFLCSPFQLDVKIALLLDYKEGRDFETQCTLSDVVENMDAFFAGDFNAGGWDGWFEMTQNPQNNPYGALLEAQMELDARIVNEQGQEVKLLDFGGGFKSFKKCTEVEGGGEKCDIINPGKVIETQLNKTLFSGQQKLIVADEFNEIITALIGQLVKTVLSEVGLFGLSNSDEGTPFFDGITDQEALDKLYQEHEEGLEELEDAGGEEEVVVEEETSTSTASNNSGRTISGTGIIWKPIPEGDNNLVILTPTNFGSPGASVHVANGSPIEAGQYVGHTNGNRATYRFSRPGSGFPSPSLLNIGGAFYNIPNSSTRYN